MVSGPNQGIADTELRVEKKTLDQIDATELRALKRKDFPIDVWRMLKTTEEVVRAKRHALGIRPIYKRVDTCAAEFATSTAYMYSSYDEECSHGPPTGKDNGARRWTEPNRTGN